MRISLLIIAALSLHATELDRIAVTVGKQVITESDIIRDLRVGAFLDHKPLDLGPEERRKSANRLVDQVLILQEASFSHISLPAKEEAAKLIDPVKEQYGKEYASSLRKYGITEDDVLEHLLAGLRAMRYTELRFRPEVQYSEDDLRDFYFTLTQKWKKQGESNIPGFDVSRDQVEKLLTGQRTAEALDRWLDAQRSETRIVYRDQAFR